MLGLGARGWVRHTPTPLDRGMEPEIQHRAAEGVSGRGCCAEHRGRRGVQTLILEMIMITDID